jgi:(S)-ureidoglycine aminohydrolase
MSNKQIQPPGVFAHHRAALTTHYAVMPPEGILPSRIPGIERTSIHVQASKGLGAEFVQILLDIQAHGGMTEPRKEPLQSFFYVIEGDVLLDIAQHTHALSAGAFAYVPPGTPFKLHNVTELGSQVIWIRKAYEQVSGVELPSALVGHSDQVEKQNKHTQGRTWQHLLPDEIQFDFAVNILSFEPGTYFPMIETHVMEHGLYMLKGQGMYLLQGDWHECWTQDFIYMAPFCPQFFYATGWEPARYLLYKNVNRDMSL